MTTKATKNSIEKLTVDGASAAQITIRNLHILLTPVPLRREHVEEFRSRISG